jgi:hypothetical protein
VLPQRNDESGLPRVVVSASVDTEEDNWVAARHGVTLANIARLPAMHERMARLGMRITYFSAYSVVDDASGAAVLRDLRSAGAEIGGHVHPWNTPPIEEPMIPRNSMLMNLPAELQHRKITRLTARMQEALDHSPTSFRAGRYALGPAAVESLAKNGYRVDSSVMPWISWRDTDEGPEYYGVPINPYRIGGTESVRQPSPGGPIVEIPMSTGYTRWPFGRWSKIHRRLRALRLNGIAGRVGLVRQVMCSPEGTTTPDMLHLSRLLVDHGVRHLQVVWHSPSLVPGLTPFATSPAEVDRMLGAIADWVEGLHRFTSPVFATVTETADLLVPGRSPAAATP